MSSDDAELSRAIKAWGRDLGFQALGIADCHLGAAVPRFERWLEAGLHGGMDYLARHRRQRVDPSALLPGTRRVIVARMDYLPEPQTAIRAAAARPETALISRYALGRDYHKILRGRLKILARRIAARVGPFTHRLFVDSAPVLEKPLAQQAGLGWIGKHTNLVDTRAGSWFFLGELFVDLPLPIDPPGRDHCGRCRACLDRCPTGAIVAPYWLDARRCIAYLTIEHPGPIPEPLRPLLGNHIHGCDLCQLVCPWNRFARQSEEPDFQPREGLDAAALVDLMAWDEDEFLTRTEGSAIRRLGHERWLRNIAVALGNAPASRAVERALRARLDHPSALVREHVRWALGHLRRAAQPPASPPISH